MDGFTTYTVWYFVGERCLKKISNYFAVSSKSVFLPIGLVVASSEKDTVLSRMVFETMLLYRGEKERLNFVPESCVGGGRTTIRIKEESFTPVSVAFKRLEEFINEAFEIFYEDDLMLPAQIEEEKSKFSQFKYRVEFLFNFGIVASIFKAKKTFKLKF